MRKNNSARFFIHNGPGVNAKCADDTSEFLTKHVVSSKDVLFTNLSETQNFDQLDSEIDNPVLVIPGGSTFRILGGLGEDSSATISKLVNEKGFHCLGICAGAFLGGNKTKVLGPSTWESPYPFYEGIADAHSATLKLSTGWDSIGPLYPDQAYDGKGPCVLTISVGERQIPQLHIDGCAFSRSDFPGPEDGSQPLGYYSHDMKKFKYRTKIFSVKSPIPKEGFSTIDEPISILSREPHQKDGIKYGGTFFSGNHFEACGFNSKLLKTCKDTLRSSAQKLEESEALIADTLAPLIKKSFGL